MILLVELSHVMIFGGLLILKERLLLNEAEVLEVKLVLV
jgi:hypothetical protein